MRRCKDRGRRTRTARPSAGYATQTSIRSRNAYTIERQYIRAIRPFLLVSNLGCRGVNRRCLRATRKTSRAFSRIASKALVNGRSMKVVNIPSTKMMKEILRVSRDTRSDIASSSSNARYRANVIATAIHCAADNVASTHRSASRRMLGTSARNDALRRNEMPGTSPGMTSSSLIAALETTPGSRPSCRARPARRRGARSARGRASTRRSRARSRGRTRPKRDRRHARRRCRP